MIRCGDRRFLSQKSAFDAVLGFILPSMLARAVNGTAAFFMGTWRTSRRWLSGTRAERADQQRPPRRPPSSHGTARATTTSLRPRLARIGDVFGACLLEDLLGVRDLFARLRMDGQQDVPRLHLALVTLRLVLRYPVPDEKPGEPARRRAGCRSSECRHDGTGGDKCPQTRDGQGADADQIADSATQHSPPDSARRRAFGCLGVLLMRKVARPLLVGEQDGDVVAREAIGSRRFDDVDRLAFGLRDTEYCLV